MQGVNISKQLEMVGSLGNGRKSGIGSNQCKGEIGKIRARLGAPIYYAPVNGVANILNDTFESSIVYFGRGNGKFGERGDRITNVRPRSDIRIEKFFQKGTIGETHFLCKFGMFRGIFF